VETENEADMMDEKLKEYYYVGRRWALDARYACTLSALSSSVAWIRYILNIDMYMFPAASRDRAQHNSSKRFR